MNHQMKLNTVVGYLNEARRPNPVPSSYADIVILRNYVADAIKHIDELEAYPFEKTDDALIHKGEVKALQEMVESLTRRMQDAQDESAKADDEAIHWKTVAHGLQLEATKGIYALMWEWKRRAEKAEAELKELKKVTA